MEEKGIGRAEEALESAGTGYGRDEYSPSRIVAFEPEKQAAETIFVKYEWRSTLCKLGVIECGQTPRRPPNRFWDQGGLRPSASSEFEKVTGRKQRVLGHCLEQEQGGIMQIDVGLPGYSILQAMTEEKTPCRRAMDPMEAHNRIIVDDDAGFVARCRQGDTEAFSHLVRRHQKKMLNVAFRMIGDYDEACDVVQESFFSAFRAIGKFRGKARFSTWLCGIVLNHSKSHSKQRVARSRREGASLDDLFQFENGNVSSGHFAREESVVERIEKRELAANDTGRHRFP